MNSEIQSILEKRELDHGDILALLKCDDEEAAILFRKAAEIKEKYLGNNIYLRGLIEYSNVCGKNCLYCGVRRENKRIERYTLTDDEVITSALTAYKLRFGSIAIQGGENTGPAFADNIERLVRTIRKLTNNELGITLSLGEQSREVFEKWFDAGAHRYLLRIEASSPNLYKRVHPDDNMHRYNGRLECLRIIKEAGYQTGTGVMIGLPFQTLNDLACDVIFMREFDIDMCGMGPYIEHSETPLGDSSANNLFLKERFGLTLRMIAIMRVIMKDINIVATTAMQTIEPYGREKAISCGANVIMPNLTPERYRTNYRLYNGKPVYSEMDLENVSGLNLDLIPGTVVGLGEWGDAPHFRNRLSSLRKADTAHS